MQVTNQDMKTKLKLFKAWLFCGVTMEILGQTTSQAQLGGVPLWTNRFSGPAAFSPAVAVDGSGSVIITGASTFTNGSYDFATIKYSAAGAALWTNSYNGSGNPYDRATALAVDHSDNVFVTGYTWFGPGDSEYVTIAYSRAGTPLWTNRYRGPAINGYVLPSAVAVDGIGDVFVTGTAGTVRYSNAGIALWTNVVASGAVAVDHNDQVFVSGGAGIVKYSHAGVPLWTNAVAGGGPFALDSGGNAIVTEFGSTIKYSGVGMPLWTNYRGGSALAVDGSGNVFVTGTPTGANGYPTAKYSGAGVLLWTNLYNEPKKREYSAVGIAVDSSGNVFVTGYVWNGSNRDYETIAYSGTGATLWTNRYNGSGNGDDYAQALAVDGSGNVFVTGISLGTDDFPDFTTIKYSTAIPPSLSITLTTSNTVAVCWPTPSTGFTLQQNTNGLATQSWRNVVGIPSDDGTTKTFIVKPPTGNQFYRLFHP
jgi:hypothetical protein